MGSTPLGVEYSLFIWFVQIIGMQSKRIRIKELLYDKPIGIKTRTSLLSNVTNDTK